MDISGKHTDGFMWLAGKIAGLAGIKSELLTLADGLNLIRILGTEGIVGWSKNWVDEPENFRGEEWMMGGYVLHPNNDEKWKK